MKRIGLLILLVLITPSIALAAGIQVTPDKLEFNSSKTQSKQIVVVNPTADVQLFEIYPDDYENSIKANPASFTLEAGARKNVTVTINPSNLSGVSSTNLSVMAKPLADNKVQVNTGVKIPITISTSGGGNMLYPVLAGAGLIIVLGAATFYFLKRRKKQQLNA